MSENVNPAANAQNVNPAANVQQPQQQPQFQVPPNTAFAGYPGYGAVPASMPGAVAPAAAPTVPGVDPNLALLASNPQLMAMMQSFAATQNNAAKDEDDGSDKDDGGFLDDFSVSRVAEFVIGGGIIAAGIYAFNKFVG